MGRPKKDVPHHSSGMYVYKLTLGYTFDGQRIRKAFYSSKSKADAKSKAEEYKINQAVSEQTGETIITDKKAFDIWATQWLETYKHGTVKEHTYNFTYKSNIDKYFIPYFKRAKLTDIRQVDIQKYFNTIRNADNQKPLAKSTLEKQKMILKDIFDAAIDNDLCYKNPVKNINYPHINDKIERQVYNETEAKEVKEYAIAHNQYDIVLLLETGIRRSELLGLKWSDFDFEEDIVHIQRAVTQTTGKIIIDNPKSLTSNRYIPFSKELSTYIQQFVDIPNAYIVNCSELPLSPSTYAKQFSLFMKKMNEETNIKALSPHELRHTFGTLLRAKDIDIYTIQKIMGHADISITASIYIHNDIKVLKKKMKISG